MPGARGRSPDLGDTADPVVLRARDGPVRDGRGDRRPRRRRRGRRNLSIARLKPLGGARALVGIAPNHHLAVLGRRAAARGETLPIAVTIGNHPAVLLASCLYLDLGADELEHAGGLLGEAGARWRAPPTGLAVPAHCELVLEGRLDYRELVEEGLVSEFHGMYEDYGPGAVVTFQRLTMRRDAIYPGDRARAPPRAPAARRDGDRRGPDRGAAAGRAGRARGGGTGGRRGAAVARWSRSTPGARPGSAQRAMFAVWASVSLIRTVTVVDADIDPWDHAEVEWARTAYARPDRDLLIVPGGAADRAEPLELRGRVAKLGIDATRKDADRADHGPPHRRREAIADARRRLAELL